MAVVLQKAQDEITLDDALLAMSAFTNGCDFRLRFEGERTFLEFGCYGVHSNLAQGKTRLLMHWLERNSELTDVAPETVMELKRRKPCLVCGGFWFKPPTGVET